MPRRERTGGERARPGLGTCPGAGRAAAVNRHQKSGKDAGEWLPRENRCWFAARVVAVKRKYRLTVDAREARALEGVLSRCASTAMMVAGERE